jgi:RimJ/RimL family protein N-acetyltransferase
MIKMDNTPILSQRLLLRKVTVAELEMVHGLHSLPETDRYNTLGIPENKIRTRTILNGWISEGEMPNCRSYTFCILERPSGKFVGLIALNLGKDIYRNAEVWYKLHPSFWNRGYGTEALRAVLDFGFHTLGLHRIEAGCAVENGASIRLLEKVGMQREGQKRKVLPLKTGWMDNYMYAILAEDFIEPIKI